MATKQNSIRTKVLEMLARREHSRAELEQKTLAWIRRQGMGAVAQEDILQIEQAASNLPTEEQLQELQKVLDEFEAKNWVSDERFVESLLNQKAHRLGGLRLKQELKTKGVDKELVQETLKDLKSIEFERACAVWQRKFNTLPEDTKSYTKQIRFIIYRGFSPEVARKVLSGQWLENLKNNHM